MCPQICYNNNVYEGFLTNWEYMENIEKNKETIILELNNKIEDLTKRSVKKINELKDEINTIQINQFHSKTIGKISEALSKAQGEMQIAGKSSAGYNFVYADLTEYVKASRPALVKFGLSVVQLLSTINNDDFVVTILSHSSGEWFKSQVKIIKSVDSRSKMSAEQALGSQISYFKKYAFASIVGVVASKELDSDFSK